MPGKATAADDPIMTAASDLPRLLRGLHPDGHPLSLADHFNNHGPVPPARDGRGPNPAFIDQVAAAGLRGRGGANFPAARKLATVASSHKVPVVVANGAEGEPLSDKDRLLLTQQPHLVLDGAALAAQAVGADQVILATKPSCIAAVTQALSERSHRHLDPVPTEVVVIPERFIAGEESALVNFLNGGPGLPTFVPPRPYERGVRGRPTLIQNVETLAHLALIARHGPEWFRAVGTPSEPGSTLVSLSGAVARAGVYEIVRGTSLDSLISQAGGVTVPLQAVLMGGYAGSWMAVEHAWGSPLCDEKLVDHGGVLAAGVIHAFPADGCGILETARILAYLAAETAGQCGPCVNGLAAIAASAHDLAIGAARRDVVEQLAAWAWQVTGRGACHHPDGATRLLDSALRTFGPDIDAHRRGRPCQAAVSLVRSRRRQGSRIPARTAQR